ncbi:MAG TPA: GNAT family N-acetyltransferase [Opitutus sp.]|nr:GNAT family N-acetyltransferase [Opitutus sp.]
MPALPSFRPYAPADLPACLGMFDGNCPQFFAPNERADFVAFLSAEPPGYTVCLSENRIVGAFGVLREGPGLMLRWILLAPDMQRRGLGRVIMERVRATVQAQGGGPLHIGTSQHSAAFFAKCGAQELGRTPDGWGPGMHRVDMVLPAMPS